MTATQLGADLQLHSDYGPMLVLMWLVVSGTALVFLAAVTALGEEIGWRGFLVPALVTRVGFHRAAVIGGVIHAVSSICSANRACKNCKHLRQPKPVA